MFLSSIFSKNLYITITITYPKVLEGVIIIDDKNEDYSVHRTAIGLSRGEIGKSISFRLLTDEETNNLFGIVSRAAGNIEGSIEEKQRVYFAITGNLFPGGLRTFLKGPITWFKGIKREKNRTYPLFSFGKKEALPGLFDGKIKLYYALLDTEPILDEIVELQTKLSEEPFSLSITKKEVEGMPLMYVTYNLAGASPLISSLSLKKYISLNGWIKADDTDDELRFRLRATYKKPEEMFSQAEEDLREIEKKLQERHYAEMQDGNVLYNPIKENSAYRMDIILPQEEQSLTEGQVKSLRHLVLEAAGAKIPWRRLRTKFDVYILRYDGKILAEISAKSSEADKPPSVYIYRNKVTEPAILESIADYLQERIPETLRQ